MNKKLLCAAMLAGLSWAQAASAQEFDDRWYLTGSAGYNVQDDDRRTENTPFVTLGLGKFISPNWSLDGELNYQNPSFDGGVVGANDDLNWSQYGLSIDLRRHFISEGRGWNPYVVAGLGYQRSEEEYDNFPSPNSPGERKDGNFAAKVKRIEELDSIMPRIVELNPTVLIVTGDHSTPSRLGSHSWHPVPTLLVSDVCRTDRLTQFGENDAIQGGLGQFEAKYLMLLAMANARRLSKFGA
jgi:hypothetical protein